MSLVVAVVTPSSLVISMFGVATSVSVSVAVLLVVSGSVPLVLSSAIEVELMTWVAPLWAGERTVVTKVAEPYDPVVPVVGLVAPPLSAPMVRVHITPDTDPSGQDHPVVDPVDWNMVFTGTVSVMTTPVAFWDPVFR